ncbi:MAG: OpgC domain-containing protein [Alphaproteobacteria bacterium]|nr:OpgC domain-containing protein [Alphaproteobacteria bacterium]
MVGIDSSGSSGRAVDPATGAAVVPRGRDVRLDFFRGLAMFIIFCAHMPGNAWTLYIPARFGPSDATEIFVFCSGFASAIAFGGAFRKYGWGVGCARVLYRCWQIYWAHIALFFTILAVVALGTFHLDTGKDYIGQLNLYHFVNDPARGIIHLMTFTYVPNLFDILPMYFGALLLLPVMILLSRVHVGLAIGFSLGLWACVHAFGWEFPAEWWANENGDVRPWYFNPLAWQLLFFTGFAFGAGWLKPPPMHRLVFWTAVVFVVVQIPYEFWMSRRAIDAHLMESFGYTTAVMNDLHQSLRWFTQKTDFGILRYLHFLALAYIALYLLRGHENKLRAPVFKPIVKVGQQALATFLAGLVLSRIGGMFLDVAERDMVTWALANLSGFALLIAVAYVAGFFKGQPWRKTPAAKSAPAPRPESAPPYGAARFQPGAAD